MKRQPNGAYPRESPVAEHGVIDVRGRKLNLRRAGQGAPLLFLHGAHGLADHEPGLDELAHHFEIIAPEHPGFGASEVCDHVDDVTDLGLFYLDVLDHLKLDTIHVVGQCIGGWVALEMAIHASHRFKTLTLVNSAGLRVKDQPRGDMFVCSEDDLVKMLFTGDAGATWIKRWRATPALEELYDRNRAAAAKYTWSPRLCNPKLDQWLHRVNAPTHIIWGANNRVIPPAYADALKTLIPGATTTILADCAHMAHVEKPQAFAEETTQFIRRTAP